MSSRPAPGTLALLGLVAGVVSGCLASHADFLRVPLRTDVGAPPGTVRVRVSVAAVRARLPGFDPDVAAFYARGRTPLGCTRVDTDGDGTTDAIDVAFPLTGDRDQALVIVSPGPAATAAPPAPASPAVELDFARARR